ncbi:MAG: hypothetical protein MHM6MM_007395 [Cercozoa sp. M6MM]
MAETAFGKNSVLLRIPRSARFSFPDALSELSARSSESKMSQLLQTLEAHEKSASFLPVREHLDLRQPDEILALALSLDAIPLQGPGSEWRDLRNLPVFADDRSTGVSWHPFCWSEDDLELFGDSATRELASSEQERLVDGFRRARELLDLDFASSEDEFVAKSDVDYLRVAAFTKSRAFAAPAPRASSDPNEVVMLLPGGDLLNHANRSEETCNARWIMREVRGVRGSDWCVEFLARRDVAVDEELRHAYFGSAAAPPNQRLALRQGFVLPEGERGDILPVNSADAAVTSEEESDTTVRVHEDGARALVRIDISHVEEGDMRNKLMRIGVARAILQRHDRLLENDSPTECRCFLGPDETSAAALLQALQALLVPLSESSQRRLLDMLQRAQTDEHNSTKAVDAMTQLIGALWTPRLDSSLSMLLQRCVSQQAKLLASHASDRLQPDDSDCSSDANLQRNIALAALRDEVAVLDTFACAAGVPLSVTL